ncbi:hypothetical protein D3C87_1722350 [compost metagenome]
MILIQSRKCRGLAFSPLQKLLQLHRQLKPPGAAFRPYLRHGCGYTETAAGLQHIIYLRRCVALKMIKRHKHRNAEFAQILNMALHVGDAGEQGCPVSCI